MNAELLEILPEMVVVLGGLALLVLPWIRSPRLLGFLALSILTGAFDLKLLQWFEHPSAHALFSGMLLQDRFSQFFQMLLLFSIGLVVLSVMGDAKQERRYLREMLVLLLLTTSALMLVVGAQHLALVYLGLEMISLLSYLLTGFLKKESLSIEGGLKYFLFGSLATGAMLYGISLVYGLTGTMDLAALTGSFREAMSRAPLLASAALLLLLVGFGFKVALVPFHMWAPDAYEGAPTPVAAFLSVGPKIAGFAVLARVFLLGITPQVTFWPQLLGLLSILTMTIGNLVALAQTNVKRLLAYSSIAHAGTMAIGFAVATPLGLSAVLYYLVAYALMNVGAFVGVIAVANASGREDLGAFAGLSRREPLLAFMITVVLLSLAGIPPLAGFFAKMWIFSAAIQSKAYGLAVIAGMNSVIALFYYVKIVKTMYLDPAPVGARPIPRSRALQLTLAICTLGVFAVGLMPGPWLLLTAQSFPVPLKPGDLPWL